MLPDIARYLDDNLDNIVQATITVIQQKYPIYRQSTEMELTIRQNVISQYNILFKFLKGQAIEPRELHSSLTALAERRLQQGFALNDVLGAVQLSKDICYQYLRRFFENNANVSIAEIVGWLTQINHLVDQLENGIVDIYSELQNKIIQSQESFLKHKFSSLFKLVEAISNNLNIQEFCDILLDYLCRFYDVKIAGIFLLDEREKIYYPQRVIGLSRRFNHEQRYPVTSIPFKQCIQSGKAVALSDRPYLKNDVLSPIPKESEQNSESDRLLCSSLYAPMVGRQKTYGVVSLHCMRLRQFSPIEIQQFETLARILAVALENARFYQNMIEEKSKLDAIVNSIKDGLVLIDFHEEIVFINEPAAKYFQQPSYRLIGGSANVIFERLLSNAKDAHIVQATYLRALANIADHPVMECTLYHPGTVDIRLKLFPVKDREHHFIGRGILIENISQENEINRMKSEFVAIASHTMRTPITSIMGFASLLLEKNMTPVLHRKYLESIHRESQQLTDIVNDMLDLAKIESGKISLQLMPIDICEMTKSVIRLVKQKTKREIQCSLPTKKMPRLIADQNKVKQALMHLLINAVVHTAGKIKLTIKKTGSIRLRAQWHHSRVNFDEPGLFPAILFSVEDKGKGIRPEQINLIFEPFNRLSVDKVSHPLGSGLGLTIVRYVIEAHGGIVWVESKQGMGSIFNILLPLELTSPEKKLGFLSN